MKKTEKIKKGIDKHISLCYNIIRRRERQGSFSMRKGFMLV